MSSKGNESVWRIQILAHFSPKVFLEDNLLSFFISILLRTSFELIRLPLIPEIFTKMLINVVKKYMLKIVFWNDGMLLITFYETVRCDLILVECWVLKQLEPSKVNDWILCLVFHKYNSEISFEPPVIMERNIVAENYKTLCSQEHVKLDGFSKRAWSRSLPWPPLSSLLIESWLWSGPFHCLKFKTVLLQRR